MTFSTVSKTALIALMFGASFASTLLSAQNGDQKRFAESQYRRDNMENAKYALANIVKILKGEASHEGHLPKLAVIMANSASMAKASFEKDTREMDGHTEAKDAIWENWSDFSSKVDKYAADTAALAKVAETGDMGQFGAAFQKATSNCKACHDTYKE